MHFDRDFADCFRILTVRVDQPAVFAEFTPYYRRQQHWFSMFRAGVIDELRQVAAIVSERRVTIDLLLGFVIVSKFNEYTIARLEVFHNAVPKPFRDEGAGAAAILGPIVNQNLIGIEILLQHFRPTSFGPPVHFLDGRGGISRDEQGDRKSGWISTIFAGEKPSGLKFRGP